MPNAAFRALNAVEGLRRNLYESITLKRGLTVDRAFNNWAGDGGKVAHGPAWVSGYWGLRILLRTVTP